MRKLFKNFIILSAIWSMLLCFGCTNDKNPNGDNSSKDIISSVILDGEENLKKVYSKNEIINLDCLSVIINYEGGKTKKIDIYNNDISVDGIDTATTGDKQIIITYLNYPSFKIDYKVFDMKATLHFMDGSYNGKTEDEAFASNGEYYLKDIIPSSNQEGYTFAGWFFDENLTKRAEYDIDGYLKAEDNIDLYAGYDVDYKLFYCYEIVNNTCKITSLNFKDGDLFEMMMMSELIIPKTIELYPVTEIGDSIFTVYDEELDMSFSYAEFFTFDTLIFPQDSYVVTIGSNAFNGILMNNVFLPDSLRTIKDQAFENCRYLTEIAIPKNVEYIGDSAFSDCPVLSKINFVEYGNLKTIGSRAFASDSNLHEIVLPEGLEQIMPEAFSLCQGISSIHISSTVNFIGLHAFQGINNLKEFTVSEKSDYYCAIDGNLYSKDETKFYQYCFGKTDESFTLPESVETIEESAFNNRYGYCSLKELNVSSNLKYIYNDAFAGMTFDLNLPSTLVSISPKAFALYCGKKIKISEDNQQFTTDNNGILYSKDFKNIYCIPGGIEGNIIYIDNRVEVIKSYACSILTNVKEINIGKDSKLEIIETNGLCLHGFESFIGLKIEKPVPFTLEDDAFKDCGALFTNKYRIVIPSANYEAYRNAWGSYIETSINFDLDQLLVSDNGLITCILEQISLCNFTSFDLFSKGVSPMFYGDITRDIYEIIRTFDLFSLLYENSFDSITYEEKNYIFAFEKQTYELVSKLYDKEYRLLTDYDITMFNICIYHYQTLPTTFKASLNDLYTTLANKVDGVNDILQRRENLKKEILNFPYSTTVFNMEIYLRIEQEIVATNLKRTSLSFELSQDIDVLECSYLIYQFNRFKGDYIHHIKEVESYLHSSIDKDGIYGILEYINNICSSYDFVNRIYGYEKFQSCYEEFLKDELDYNNSIVKEIEDFDLSVEYNEIAYKQIYDKINELSNNSVYDYDTIVKKDIIMAIYLMNMYNKTYKTVDDDNFLDGYKSMYEIDGLIYMLDGYDLKTETIIALENEYITVRNNVIEYQNTKLNAYKEAIKNFDFTKEAFDFENYNIAKDLNLQLGYNANMVDYYDENDYGEYSSLYSIILIYYDIYNLCQIGKDGVTGSNFNDLYKLLYGRFDIEYNNFVEGINNNFTYIYHSEIQTILESMYYYDMYITIENEIEAFLQ